MINTLNFMPYLNLHTAAIPFMVALGSVGGDESSGLATYFLFLSFFN